MLDHILVRSDRLQIDSYYKSGDEKLYASESEIACIRTYLMNIKSSGSIPLFPKINKLRTLPVTNSFVLYYMTGPIFRLKK